MNENRTTHLLWLAAAVCLVIGVCMTVKNLGRSSDISARFGKLIDELKVLRSMEADMDRYDFARQKMEKSPDKHPVPINGILLEVLPGSKSDDIRDSRKDAVEGWWIRQKEISLNEVSIGKAMEFVQKAESQKLPWCLTRCVIRAAPRVGGTGQVILLMEALEKAE